MFWKYNNTPSSPFDAVLREDVTLKELMDKEDIINECKGQNKALIDFLSKPEIMEELVTLTCIEPPPDMDESTRFKYPNIACELLTCDVPALNERLAGDEALLAKLYMFLDSEPPLNPLLASFFSKIMGVLIAKKTEQVLDFLKAKDNFISLLLKHLGTSAIMDLTLKLMTQVEGLEMRQNILNWLDSQNIIQSLISLLDPQVDSERHYNVAQLLCDFIKTARDIQRNSVERMDPDPLLNTIESPETVTLLLDYMLGGDKKNESAVVGGIQVLLTILDTNKSSIPKYDSQNIYNSTAYDEAGDVEHRQKVIQNTVKAIQNRLKDFHNLLLEPPKKKPVETTFGILDPPVGNLRLQITKLIASVILSNNADAIQELITLNTMQVLLDLFFKYQWNNFLHTQVELCINSALKAEAPQDMGDCNALSKHLLVNCKLVERILEAWKENDQQQSENKGVRQGYMGHLINIVNQLVKLCSSTPLGQFLKDNLPEVSNSLDQFQDSTLQEINKTQETLLGGAHPNTSNEDSDEYGDIPFPQSALIHQQMFAQYQIQQLTPNMIGNYGFNDDDFNDAEDMLQTIDHRTNMTFEPSEGDLVQQHELFKQICAGNINTLDDADDQIFEDRDHTFQTVIEKQERRDAVYSSDSDDESPPPAEDPLMDIDPWSSPDRMDEKPSTLTAADPWGVPDASTAANSGGWADFNSATFGDFSNESKMALESASVVNIKTETDTAADEKLPKKESVDNAGDNVAHDVGDKEITTEIKNTEYNELPQKTVVEENIGSTSSQQSMGGTPALASSTSQTEASMSTNDSESDKQNV